MEAGCKVRARGPSEADFDEAREADISSCTKATEKSPRYQETLSRMILDASTDFPDPLPPRDADGRRAGQASCSKRESEFPDRWRNRSGRSSIPQKPQSEPD